MGWALIVLTALINLEPLLPPETKKNIESSQIGRMVFKNGN
jgi:hypothetical protein